MSVFGAPLGNKSDPGVRMWMVLMSNVAPILIGELHTAVDDVVVNTQITVI